jgi:hypothetical protein
MLLIFPGTLPWASPYRNCFSVNTSYLFVVAMSCRVESVEHFVNLLFSTSIQAHRLQNLICVCTGLSLRTKYFDHHTCSFDFFNQMTLINCKTVMSLEVIPTSYFFNIVIPSGGGNNYRQPRGAVLLASQVARSLSEGCCPQVWGGDCHCITHGWLYREDIT